MYKRLSYDMIIYGLGKGISFFLQFVFLYFVTKLLSPNEYGLIELILTVTIAIGHIITMGLNSGQSYFFFKKDKQNLEHRTELISTILSFQMLVGLLLFLIIVIVFLTNRQFFYKSNVSLFSVIFAYLSSFILSIQNQLTEIHRLNNNRVSYIIITLLNNFFSFGLGIYFLSTIDLKTEGYFLAFTLGGIVPLIISAYTNKEYIKLSLFKLSIFNKLITFSIPIFITNLLIWVLDITDKWSIKLLLSTELVGVYSVGQKVSFFIMFFVIVFRTAWWPFAMEKINSKDVNNNFIINVSKIYLSAGLIGVLVLNAFSKDIIELFFDSNYSFSYNVVGYIALSNVLYGYILISQLGIIKSENTKWLILIEITSAILNLILNFLFIIKFNFIGAAIATMISVIFRNTASLIISEKKHKIGLNYRNFLFQVLLASITLFFFQKNEIVYITLMLISLFYFISSVIKTSFKIKLS